MQGCIPFIFSMGLMLTFWGFLTFFMGTGLVPSPVETFSCLAKMLLGASLWENVAISVFRGLLAISTTLFLALITGILAGLSRKTMSLITPLVVALQATPPILWITLLMIWAGTGSTVPIAVVIASLYPPLFFTVAQSVASLDPRLFSLAKIYGVKNYRLLKDLILPGIHPYLLGGLSYALGSCWKVTAVAEFFGSSRGIGAGVYWSYRMLDMPQLFSWAIILVGMGMGIEFGLIRPLRRRALAQRGIDAQA
ncbi:NitT/TauT family transport system permease protein [Desulfobotulus alkaliphilus]|uniref:NitT/TauT family transport system permease protein n=1 Tax=Desulfobotulus alkaliphilus TaxID=622671 RepID=A0A562REW2_9BACT|nr:ABC transporter permease subunit [Desulfobotulus alkaliphilus]TWI66956.1 NitT/TauT family transport system permease protein [Desulfobotulus alkaliphilus]